MKFKLAELASGFRLVGVDFRLDLGLMNDLVKLIGDSVVHSVNIRSSVDV